MRNCGNWGSKGENNHQGLSAPGVSDLRIQCPRTVLSVLPKAILLWPLQPTSGEANWHAWWTVRGPRWTGWESHRSETRFLPQMRYCWGSKHWARWLPLSTFQFPHVKNESNHTFVYFLILLGELNEDSGNWKCGTHVAILLIEIVITTVSFCWYSSGIIVLSEYSPPPMVKSPAAIIPDTHHN